MGLHPDPRREWALAWGPLPPGALSHRDRPCGERAPAGHAVRGHQRPGRPPAAPPDFKHEYFQLYQKYLAARHPGGGMDNPTPQSFMEFLTASWADTIFYEFRLDRHLLAIAVVDRMEDALSAVYTFFDPDHSARSLGRFAILCEIEAARIAGLKWLYLGYWIKECRKMRYKSEYRPFEYMARVNDWRRSP
ncbi:MAG TPA: hypothetical protein VE965_06835 [Gammaproteobacteria bacterium]|nr:hypothetical protein [Gammaproteobacteria bacterium]